VHGFGSLCNRGYLDAVRDLSSMGCDNNVIPMQARFGFGCAGISVPVNSSASEPFRDQKSSVVCVSVLLWLGLFPISGLGTDTCASP
jgi:hypothetical protein